MAVTDEQVAVLRAQLKADREEYDRRHAQLDLKSDSKGYAMLLTAAFTLATEQRFPPPVTLADLIRYVADVRSRTPSAAENVDPKIAERLLLAALTDDSISDLDGKAIGVNQSILLVAMVADKGLDPAGLEEFIEEARELANEWTSS